MKFRLARESDLDQLARMRWSYWLEGGADPAKQDEKAFVNHVVETFTTKLNKDWFVWCALEKDLILSHVYIQRIQKVPKPSAPVDAFGYVTNVYTRPQHRNKGIGSQVLSHVKAWALEMDLEFLMLWPNEPSIPFWRRMDFRVDDPLVRKIRPYVN